MTRILGLRLSYLKRKLKFGTSKFYGLIRGGYIPVDLKENFTNDIIKRNQGLIAKVKYMPDIRQPKNIVENEGIIEEASFNYFTLRSLPDDKNQESEEDNNGRKHILYWTVRKLSVLH